MPKITIFADIDQEILKVLSGASSGISIDELIGLLKGEVSRRSLQRHLAALVESDKVLTAGAGRSTRYLLHKASCEDPVERDYVPLSPAGQDVRQAVQKPLSARTSVGYRKSFLDRYRPNETAYLSKDTIAHLGLIGATSHADRTPGTFARQIFHRWPVDLSWASSRLDGNTYSLLDTKILIEGGKAAKGKDPAEPQMILNHKAAIEFMMDLGDELSFDRQIILNLHAILSDNLLPDPVSSGRLRRIGAGIAESVYQPPDLPQLIEEYFARAVDTAAAISDPFEQAFFATVHLSYLQPFQGVNEQVSRLAANIPLLRANLAPLSFIDVPTRAYVDGLLGVYELNKFELLRDVFVYAYERSAERYVAVRQPLGEPDQFRIRFRNELIVVVGAVVRGSIAPTAQEVTRLAEPLIPAEHLTDFVRVAVSELENLHNGNFGRFRLRPSEYHVWREAFPSQG
ncbi:MAG TPA: Fic family protein [Blastocatellia bacterium]